MGIIKSPAKWAIDLSNIIKIFHEHHSSENRFPIRIKDIAIDYSKQVFPDEPIDTIAGEDLPQEIEGMLMHDKNRWGIFYNKNQNSIGRQNFTLAHELGHYLMHRKKLGNGIKCSRKDLITWDSEYSRMEYEANMFASYILMPLDDYRDQIQNTEINMDIFNELSRRYCVSLTAVILKWLKFTTKKAMLVMTFDDHIDWAWSSKNLLKDGVYYKAKQVVTPLPKKSLLHSNTRSTETTIIHDPGVWPHPSLPAKEMIARYRGYNYNLSLIIFE